MLPLAAGGGFLPGSPPIAICRGTGREPPSTWTSSRAIDSHVPGRLSMTAALERLSSATIVSPCERMLFDGLEARGGGNSGDGRGPGEALLQRAGWFRRRP